MTRQQALPFDVERVAKRSTSRVVRRPTRGFSPEPFLVEIARALDRAGVKPGESFYVHRVPPPDRRSHLGDLTRVSKWAETRRALLQHFERRGNLGNTATDAAISIGDAYPGGWRRASELVQAGHLRRTDRRARTVNGGMAAVLVITNEGRAALEASP